MGLCASGRVHPAARSGPGAKTRNRSAAGIRPRASIGNPFRRMSFKGTKSLACGCTMLEGRWRNDETRRGNSRAEIYAITRAAARSVHRRTVSASMRSRSTVKPQPMPRGICISPLALTVTSGSMMSSAQ